MSDMSESKIPLSDRLDDKNLKLSSNIMSVIFAVLAIYLLVYGTTTLGKVFAGMAIASIPLVRLSFTSIMVTDKTIDVEKVLIKNTDKAIDVAKASIKNTKKVINQAEVLIDISEEKDKLIKNLVGLVNESLDKIDSLMDEVKPLSLDIKNKSDVIVTLVEAEKIKVTYGNQSDYATPESLGMVDKKKNASLYWVWMKLFCELSGYMNFNLNYDYSDKKVKNRIQQQLSRFRKRFGEAFGIEIESSDYKFNKGEWIWKTINWRDEFSTHQEKLARQEIVEMMKDAKTGAYLKSVRKVDFTTGEQMDRANDPSTDEYDGADFDEENYDSQL